MTQAAAISGAWVSRGEVVEIDGVRISAGGFYLRGPSGFEFPVSGHCVVDPSLPTDRSSRDLASSSATRYGYDLLAPAARQAYLEWLADDRRSGDVPLCFFRIHAEGLFHRAIGEGLPDEALTEAARMISLHRRVHPVVGETYGNVAVWSTAGAFDPARPPRVDPFWRYSVHAAPEVVIRAALAAREGRSLSVDEAFAFAWEHRKIRLGRVDFVAARACFRRMFADRFPGGVSVSAQGRLQFGAHTPAGLRGCRLPLAAGFSRLSDPRSDAPFVDAMRTLMDECAAAVGPYSRLISRDPAERGSLKATAMLPPSLMTTSSAGRFGAAARSLKRLVGAEGVLVSPVSELVRALRLGEDARIASSSSVRSRVDAVLDGAGIAYEPDRRYGAVALRSDGMVALSRGEGGGPVAANATFLAYRAAIHFLLGEYPDRDDAELFGNELGRRQARETSLEPEHRSRLALFEAWVRADVRPGARTPSLDPGVKRLSAAIVASVIAENPPSDAAALSAAEAFIAKMGGDRAAFRAAVRQRPGTRPRPTSFSASS